MSVAKVVEITAESERSFEDAVRQVGTTGGTPPLWDGQAAHRIVSVLRHEAATRRVA